MPTIRKAAYGERMNKKEKEVEENTWISDVIHDGFFCQWYVQRVRMPFIFGLCVCCLIVCRIVNL